MADKKISQLTGATTPLAGSEEVPLVQSGVTKKVSVTNLTAGRSVTMSALGVGKTAAYALDVLSSNLDVAYFSSPDSVTRFNLDNTSANGWGSQLALKTNNVVAGYFASIGSLLGSTVQDPTIWATAGNGVRVYTNGNNLRLNVASGGDVTVNTGNLVIGTSGKGIDFSATPGTGTSELLADYEEGTWTPTVSGFGSPVYTVQNGNYTKVGNLVHITGKLSFSGASGASAVSIDGLPYASGNPTDAFQRASCFVEGDFTGCSTFIASYGMFRTNGTSLQGVKAVAGASALAIASDFLATVSFNFSLTYYV